MSPHRDIFSLPPIKAGAGTPLAVPTLPPHEAVTGDKEVDAVLWLQSIVKTGDPALIAQAVEAAKRIQTPMKVLEERYRSHLLARNPGSLFAALSSFGFGELGPLAAKSVEKARLRHEALARFGSQEKVFEETPAETFAMKALKGARTESLGFFVANDVNTRFFKHQDMLPKSLTDCLAELTYWRRLYQLRAAFDGFGEGPPEAFAREEFVMRCMASIAPTSRTEAMAVFDYLTESDRLVPAILRNLIRGPQRESESRHYRHRDSLLSMSKGSPS